MHSKTKINTEHPQTMESTLNKIDQQQQNHRFRTDSSLSQLLTAMYRLSGQQTNNFFLKITEMPIHNLVGWEKLITR